VTGCHKKLPVKSLSIFCRPGKIDTQAILLFALLTSCESKNQFLFGIKEANYNSEVNLELSL